MTIETNELAAYYASLTDEELIRRSAQELTAEARRLVDQALQSRGLAIPPVAETPPGIDAAVEASAGASVEWVDIAQCDDPAEAYLLKAYLESFDIPVTVIGADVARTFSSAVGGSRLSVPTPLVEQALERMADYHDRQASPDEPDEDPTPDVEPPVSARLKTYRVYAHPERRIHVVVRSGFNWAALIFGPLWFLVNRMWVNALIFLALIVGNSLYVRHADPVRATDFRIDDLMFILYLLVWLLFSALANTLLCADLEGKGYVLKATVRARNPAYAREAALKAARGR